MGKRDVIRAGLIALVGVAVVWHPLVLTRGVSPGGDFDYFLEGWELVRTSWEAYATIPFWDPYKCVGRSIYTDPLSLAYSPTALATVFFGSAFASRLFIVAHAVAGFAGMYLWARAERQSIVASTVASAIFGFVSFHWAHLNGGHANFAPAYLLPTLFLLLHRAYHRRHGALVGSAFVAALMVYEGGYYALAAAVPIGVCQFWPSSKDEFWGRLAVVFTFFGLTGLLSAFRIIPLLWNASQDVDRQTPLHDRASLSDLVSALVDVQPATSVYGHFSWEEYTMLIGWPAVGLTVLGCAVASRARWKICLAVGFFLGMGAGGLWDLVHTLPVYASLRAPARFLFIVVVMASLLAGAATTWLQGAVELVRLRPLKKLFPLLLVIVLSGMWPLSHYAGLWSASAPAGTISRQPLRVGHRFPTYHLPSANQASTVCESHQGTKVAPTIRAGGLVAETDHSKVLKSGHRINTIWARVNGEAVGSIVFNQNYDKNFRSSVGQVGASGGRLAVVNIPPGDHELVVKYHPPLLAAAFSLTLLGWICCFIVCTPGVFRRLQRFRTSMPKVARERNISNEVVTPAVLLLWVVALLSYFLTAGPVVVGGDGTIRRSTLCHPSEAVVGVESVYAGDAMVGVRPLCRDASGRVRSGDNRGSLRGVTVANRCATHVVGLDVNADEKVRSVIPICAGGAVTKTTAGSRLLCGRDVVVGFTTRGDTMVNALGLRCHPRRSLLPSS